VRTTVDLAPAVHERARDLAKEQHQSLSATLANLVARGLEGSGHPAPITINPISGLPTIRLGRPITAEEVANILDEDE